MKYLFIISLLFLSCKEDKSNATPTTPTAKKERVAFTIPNQIFHLKVDGRDKPEKHVDVLGQYVTDRFGATKKCVFLDGISDYIEVQNSPNLNPTKALTISIWYKPDSYKGNGNNALVWKGFTKYEAPYCQYLLSAIGNLYPTKHSVFKFGLTVNGKYNLLQTKPNIWQPDNWYNITGTYDGNTMKLFVNGKLQNQRKINGEISVFNTPLLIGKTPHKEFYTSGTVDDFRLFNKALTDKEIKQLYQEQ